MLQIITLPNGHHSTFNFADRSFHSLSHPHLSLYSFVLLNLVLSSVTEMLYPSSFSFFLFFSLIPPPFPLYLWHPSWLSSIPFQVFHSLCPGHPVIFHSIKVDIPSSNQHMVMVLMTKLIIFSKVFMLSVFLDSPSF